MYVLSPDNFSGTGVNSGERAQYTITNNKNVNSYKLMNNAAHIDFPSTLSTFEPGRVYTFIYDGSALTMIQPVNINLNNIAAISKNIPTPAAPVVETGDKEVGVFWTPVQGANIYEVYLSTSTVLPAFPVRTTMGTSAIFEELVNRTVYSIWIKAYSNNGYSDFSSVVQATPWSNKEAPAVPGRPMIVPGINQVTVSWNESAGAASYEVYYSTESTPPNEPAVETDKTSAVIYLLQSNTTYSFWVRAVNSAGKSVHSAREIGRANAPTEAPAVPDQPVLIAGNGKITVIWQPVQLAFEYEIWYGTDNVTALAQKHADVAGNLTQAVISGLNNYIDYYVWIRAKNSADSSAYSQSASAKPQEKDLANITPKTPVVNFDDQQLIVTWEEVEEATSYEVWYYTANNSSAAFKSEDTASLTAAISGLTNKTTYYVWIRAMNSRPNSISNFSSVATGIPNITHTVSFNADGGSPAPGTQKVVDGGKATQPALMTKPTYTFDGWYKESAFDTKWNFNTDTVAENITLYAKWNYNGEFTVIYNSNGGIGAMSNQTVVIGTQAKLKANSFTLFGGTFLGWALTPSGTLKYQNEAVVEDQSKGTELTLYAIWNDNAVTLNGATISAKRDHLYSVVQNGGIYRMNLTQNESIAPMTFTNGGKTNITIIIKGIDEMRTINLASNGALVTISTGVTLILDENVTLTGRSNNNNSLVVVNSGATLILNGGSITNNGNINNTYFYDSNNYSLGGGVHIASGGTFTMNGGTISGNTNNAFSAPGGGVYNAGTFTMNGGTISGNSNNPHSWGGGGGVYNDESSGTFTMNGGTISNNTSRDFGGGVMGPFTMTGGIISGNTAGVAGVVVVGGGGGVCSGNFTKTGGIIYGSDGGSNSNTGSGSAGGHAVYTSWGKKRDATVGEDINLTFYSEINFSGPWDN